MSAPFERGEAVVLTRWGIKGTVLQCVHGVGGWRVMVKGPALRANPQGLYDFAAEQVSRDL